jgi:hypothetical protein
MRYHTYNGVPLLPGMRAYCDARGPFYDMDGLVKNVRDAADGSIEYELALTPSMRVWIPARDLWPDMSHFVHTIDPVQPIVAPVAIRLQTSVSDELLAYIARNPDSLHEVHPGVFEDVVGAIYRNHGFDVERVGRWNQADGGVDLLAVRKELVGGPLRLAIQCKHITGRSLSAEPIRSLAGVLDRFQAHKGVVATSGLFSRAAVEEKELYFWNIDLMDALAIKDRLSRLLA